jgi:hypothetical protein
MYEENIMKHTKYCSKEGEEKVGLRECNRGAELIQSILYDSIKCTHCKLPVLKGRRRMSGDKFKGSKS